MSTRLIICRHGNTFGPDDTPTRVGARTDLDLVTSGYQQAEALGTAFKAQDYQFARAFCSHLKRTRQTAETALDEMGYPDQQVDILNFLAEIDYGPDEDRTEDEVIARIGAPALAAWDEHAIVPAGWLADPEQMASDWLSFGEYARQHFKGQTILLVTSNGAARFAPYLTMNYDLFKANNNIKLKTGAYGVLTHNGSDAPAWQVESWNIRPSK